MLGVKVWGSFEAKAIGQSSTFRELKGFVQMLKHPQVAPMLNGKTVRFNMDCKPALANLLKSGPVKALAPWCRSFVG